MMQHGPMFGLPSVPTSKPRQRCTAENCTRARTYGVVGGVAVFCSQHKTAGMADLKHKLCEAESCFRHPYYGEIGQKPRFCSLHKSATMTNLRNRRCEHQGCSKQPSFNIDGQGREDRRPRFCGLHKTEGMVDVTNKKCSLSSCRAPRMFEGPDQRSRFCEAHNLDPCRINAQQQQLYQHQQYQHQQYQPQRFANGQWDASLLFGMDGSMSRYSNQQHMYSARDPNVGSMDPSLAPALGKRYAEDDMSEDPMKRLRASQQAGGPMSDVFWRPWHRYGVASVGPPPIVAQRTGGNWAGGGMGMESNDPNMLQRQGNIHQHQQYTNGAQAMNFENFAAPQSLLTLNRPYQISERRGPSPGVLPDGKTDGGLQQSLAKDEAARAHQSHWSVAPPNYYSMPPSDGFYVTTAAHHQQPSLLGLVNVAKVGVRPSTVGESQNIVDNSSNGSSTRGNDSLVHPMAAPGMSQSPSAMYGQYPLTSSESNSSQSAVSSGGVIDDSLRVVDGRYIAQAEQPGTWLQMPAQPTQQAIDQSSKLRPGGLQLPPLRFLLPSTLLDPSVVLQQQQQQQQQPIVADAYGAQQFAGGVTNGADVIEYPQPQLQLQPQHPEAAAGMSLTTQQALTAPLAPSPSVEERDISETCSGTGTGTGAASASSSQCSD